MNDATDPSEPDPAPAVETSRLSSHGLAPGEHFELWRAAVSSVFEVAPAPGGDGRDFRGDLATHNAGAFLVGRSTSDPLAIRRDEARVAAVGVDHMLFQLYRGGEAEFDADGREGRVGTGDLVAFDLARPHRSRTARIDVVSLVVPRALIRLSPRRLDGAHGLVIPGGSAIGRILAGQLAALEESVPLLGAETVPLAAELVSTLVTVGLSGSDGGAAPSEAQPQLIAATLQAIRAHVEASLHDPELSPETLARHFALSRSALYRMFEPLGGVADYIRDRRLDRAALHLASVGAGRGGVARLARHCGFASEAAFARAFRQRFGLAPREAAQRALALADRAPPLADERRNWLQGWMESLAAAGSTVPR